MNTFSKIALSIPLAAGLLFGGGYLRFRQKTGADARDLMAQATKGEPEWVTAAMLRDLPEPVQRYLTYSGVVGRPMVQTARLRQRGRIRQDETQPWMPFTAEEYYGVSPSAFLWRAGARMGGLPLARVRDEYVDGRGRMLVTIGGLFPLQDMQGPEMDQGGMMRFLNEMIWFPTAFLGDNVTWESIDAHSARVTLHDSGQTATALMTFDDAGRVTNFTADRYRAGESSSTLVPWSTPITGYGEFEGLRLPVKGSGVWHLDSGDLTYIELEILDVEYNNPALYQ